MIKRTKIPVLYKDEEIGHILLDRKNIKKEQIIHLNDNEKVKELLGKLKNGGGDLMSVRIE